MRIAMLTNNYKPFIGGVPISIERLADGLRKEGHQVYIFAPYYDQADETEEGVIRYPSFHKQLAGAAIPNTFTSFIEKKIKELSIDIIHVHHPFLVGNVALHLQKKYKIPVVFTYHTRYEQYLHYLKPFEKLESCCGKAQRKLTGKMEQKLMQVIKEKMVEEYIRRFANHCAYIFAPTELIRCYLREREIETAIKILPTGILEESFEQAEGRKAEIRASYAKEGKFLFCTVSRLAKEKNIEFQLHALKKLKEEKKIGFCFLIIGDGPKRGELENLAKDLGLQQEVRFLGNIDNHEIKNYQAASDLFLFSSKSETQGIVLLEAMAAGNPIVAIEASGVCDIVQNGKNGYMTKEEEQEWVEAILNIIENPKIWNKMKEEAVDTARQYSSQIIARNAEVEYEYVIRKHKMEHSKFTLQKGYVV